MSSDRPSERSGEQHADGGAQDPPAVLVAHSLGIPTIEALRLLENQRARRRNA